MQAGGASNLLVQMGSMCGAYPFLFSPKLNNDMETYSGRTEYTIKLGGDPSLRLEGSTSHAAHIGEVTLW